MNKKGKDIENWFQIISAAFLLSLAVFYTFRAIYYVVMRQL